METSRLKQFRAIVDAGGLLRASELLGISGGGLSKSMKVLEQELGYSLFAQKGRGLELTTHGRLLYERLPPVLRSLDELLTQTKPSPEKTRLLRIASFEVFTTYFLPQVLAQHFKDWSLEAREAIPGQMEAMVAEEQSDFGLTYLPIPHPKVEFVKCGRVRMGIYGLKSAWAKTPVANMDFVVPILPIEGSPSGVQGLDGWPDHLFERKIQYRVGMMETALQLCRMGKAVAFLPEFVVRLMNQNLISEARLSELGFPSEIDPVHRDVFLIHRKGTEEAKAMRDLAKAIRALT